MMISNVFTTVTLVVYGFEYPISVSTGVYHINIGVLIKKINKYIFLTFVHLSPILSKIFYCCFRGFLMFSFLLRSVI